MSKLRTGISDTNLRRRLILGSISLAVAVSIIFIVVAYRLASDLAESTEIRHFDKQFHWLFSELEELNKTINDPVQQLATVKNKFIYKSMIDNILAIQVLPEDRTFQANSIISKSPIEEKLRSLNFPNFAKGAFFLEDKRLFWQFKSSSESQFSLLVVYEISSLEEALDYVAKRLSITAFLTFWLAIWAALTMSAIIAKRFEENNQKLTYLAMHDNLSGLKNRTYLHEFFSTQIEKQIANEPKNKDPIGALLIIDLNKFKDVNDTFGHGIGDELLIVISHRLQAAIDERDLLVRYGGDEFVIWFNMNDTRDIQQLVESILYCCTQPVPLANSQFEVGASIGIAYCPNDGNKLDTLCKHADIAMYQAKKLRTGFEFYQKQLPIFSERQVLLRGQLSQALALQQFVLVYQPKVSLLDGDIIGAEALARWQHPVDGLLSPAEFIDLIEQSDVIHSFSRFVISEAIRQAKEWETTIKSIPISINLSAYNLADPQIVPYISQQLDYYQLPAHLLEIELTESASMIDIEVTQNAFIALRALGVKLSIDDFGTGMSSFAYLRELDMDYVKIDRSFIAAMLGDKRSEKVVKGIISMCHSLESEVIAEGIETKEQAQKLLELGCRLGQGYFYARPSSAKNVTESLLSNRRQ
ncbi:putative bifunctional diguanylate cyclase/phosphodiesterase [Glaciecola sp. SC05]|uniref:putative bifunctional diguanylate cyclase/phosphodiesterase n=1 Tax=Glaciecola sp. SC05 TaxID=1987355 RepID=UPI0035275A42